MKPLRHAGHFGRLASRAVRFEHASGGHSAWASLNITSFPDLVFDPTVVPPGIELSDDPVLHFRSESYAESHRRRSSETKPAVKAE